MARHDAPAAGRLRELPQAGACASRPRSSSARPKGCIEQLLPVLDNFELALRSIGEDATRRCARASSSSTPSCSPCSERNGLERIDAVGAPFDPNEHEAVMQDDGDGEPVVGDVLRTGWKLKGRVLRPAMVKVTEEAGKGSERGRAARVVREGLLRRPRRLRGLDATRSSRAPTRSWRSSTTRTPTTGTRTPRSASRRSPRRTTCSATAPKRKEYDEVRRMVASGVGPGGGGFGPGGFGGPGGQTFHFETDGDGGFFSDLLGGMFGGGGGRPARRGGGATRTAARPGPRDRAAPLVRRRGAAASRARCGSAPTRCATRATATAPRRARSPETCPQCHGVGIDRGRPGTVLVLAGVPDVRWARPGDPDAVPDVSRPRRRGARPRREGAHPGRRRRRPAHPRQGSRRRRCERRTGRRPLRRRARRAAPAVRPQRQRPHAAAAGHVRRSGARCRREGADARRPGDGADPAGHAERQGACACAARASTGGNGKGAGDLLVTVDVQVPDELNDEQRDAVEALANVLDDDPRAALFAQRRRPEETDDATDDLTRGRST